MITQHEQTLLKDEIALVTGGTRNIGLAIADALAFAGARVCVVGSSDHNALEVALTHLHRRGHQAMGLLADVGQEAAVVGIFEKVASSWGPVSILVNCAAVRPHKPLKELSLASWSSVLGVILTGAFLTSREMFRRLPTDRRGAIVNIGGLSAHRPAKDRAHVIAAKAGLVGLTRALAAEGQGWIRANCVVPGVIDTSRRPGQPPPDFGKHEETQRAGTCDDVARAVQSLADPRDIYVTGQTLHVNGGRFMP